jgi:hypothetical protein
MRDVIETIAKSLGWLDTDEFVKLPSPFAGFPIYAIGDTGEDDEWK